MSKAGERLIVKFLAIIAANTMLTAFQTIQSERADELIDKFEKVTDEMKLYLEIETNTDV